MSMGTIAMFGRLASFVSAHDRVRLHGADWVPDGGGATLRGASNVGRGRTELGVGRLPGLSSAAVRLLNRPSSLAVGMLER